MGHFTWSSTGYHFNRYSGRRAPLTLDLSDFVIEFSAEILPIPAVHTGGQPHSTGYLADHFADCESISQYEDSIEYLYSDLWPSNGLWMGERSNRERSTVGRAPLSGRFPFEGHDSISPSDDESWGASR